ncbi:MAG: carboxypeptidase-like regulatory domain-containing protein [Gemmatimonadaceae bacterium]
MPCCSLARAALLAVIFSVLPVALRAQTHADVIRDRVTTDSGRVISGADVIATMAPNREIFRTTTDTGGRYQLNISAGTGDYLLYVGATGRKAFRKRVTRVRAESTFVVDARMMPDVVVMAAIRTTAQKTRPPRGDEAPSELGGLTSRYGTVAGALSPDQMGDLNAMAATVPGVTVTPDGGISVFGVDAGQNKIALNGLAFDGASLPRDLETTTHVASSVYDPTIGGFGGAFISTTIAPGKTITNAAGHVSLDAPQLQASDAAARQLGQPFTNLSASYQRSGELQQDVWVYRAAVQGSRRTSIAPSILSSDGAALDRLGVARDSADRFLQVLGGVGIPSRVNGIGSDVTSTNLSGAFRLDRAQSYLAGGLQIDTRPRLALVGVGSVRRADGSATPGRRSGGCSIRSASHLRSHSR